MKEIFQSKTFWFASIALAVIFFLFGISYNRSYVGEVEILVLPKSHITARNIDQIMANVREVPFSLNFYNKLLQKNESIADNIFDVPNAEKKNKLNSLYKVTRVKDSTIARVYAYSSNPLQADVLARGVAKQIAVSMSQYYNIRTDLEIRLLDEPIVFEKSRVSNMWVIIPSLFFGFIFSGLFFAIKQEYWDDLAPTLKSVMRERKRNIAAITEPAWTEPAQSTRVMHEQVMDNQAIHLEKEKTLFATEEIEGENLFKPLFQEKKPAAFSSIKKSSAPDNLPVGSEFILNNLKLIEKKQAEKEKNLIFESKNDNAPRGHEATEEEIKARLNKLLGGGK